MPLGHPAQWPRSLVTIFRTMLGARYAMWLAWGQAHTFFCNDACRPMHGPVHGDEGEVQVRMRGIQGIEREHHILERQVGHLVRLVDDLLDVSRIFGDKLSLQKAPVALAHAVSLAIEATGPLFEQKRQRISVDVPPTGLAVLADSERLTQIISSLLTHAARCTPAEGRVGIGAQRLQSTVVLVVSDEGGGMNVDDLSNIFETFVRGPQRKERADGHLGLGLAIARSLARQQGGELTAARNGPGRAAAAASR